MYARPAGFTRSKWRAVIAAALLCVAASAGAQTADTAGRLARLEQALDNKGLLDLVRQVEMLQQEVRQLRGELENQTYALEQLRKSQREAYLDADRRLATLEGGVAPGEPGIASAPVDPPLPTLSSPADAGVAGTPSDASMSLDIRTPAEAVGSPPEVSTPPGAVPGTVAALEPPPGGALDPAPPVALAPAPSILPAAPSVDSAASEAAYREAFSLLKAGQYDQSIAAFNAFLQTYPNSQYGDNAQYWLGEAYYVMRQFEPAIEQYQKLVNNYPDSKKQSHAMLKIAYAYHELGLRDQATQVLADLRNRFPGSAAARLAEERLARIRSESL